MANKNIFQSSRGRILPNTDTVNEAGGTAYKFEDKHALAQLLFTGTLNDTYYGTAGSQLDEVVGLLSRVDPEFAAKAGILARSEGHMKDMPALVLATLASKDRDTFNKVFERIVDNGRMLRNFVQILRSGVTGRKSFGTALKRKINNWLNERPAHLLFKDSVGNDPSLADIIKMTHPKPATAERAALYAYLIGKEYSEDNLPLVVQQYERFKRGDSVEPPKVEFRMLTSLPLTRDHWVKIAKDAPWHMTRMNLNTFARHGVFEVSGMEEIIAHKLTDPNAIQKARVFPYQLLAAYKNVSDVPRSVENALQDALELAVENVPEFGCRVAVFPDVSGSMGSSVTGYRSTATSKVRCHDVSALVAATVLRRNPGSVILPFEGSVRNIRLNERDTIMTNAEKLARIGGGSTNCSAPLAALNEAERKSGKSSEIELVIYVSDNESWVDSNRRSYWGHGPTETLKQWEIFKRNNPNAKMVCIDIQPYTSTQAQEREDILNIGGFSDNTFKVIKDFVDGKLNPEHWVGLIEEVEL